MSQSMSRLSEAGLATRVFILSLGLAFLYAGPTRSALAQHLLEARVPVADQRADARAEALETAITQVLMRLSGRADIARATAVTELIANPQRYLQQYYYEEGEGSEDSQLELIARFDGQSLRRALSQRQIPIWQAERPPVLVWFAFDSGDERELVNAAAAGRQPLEALHSAVGQLGVPVIFPMLDLQDRQSVQYSDVAGGFSEPVLEASQRYASEWVLMLRVTPTGSGWQARWALYHEGANTRWKSHGVSIEETLSQGAQVLAAGLRPSYTLVPDLTASTRLRIRIGGVDSLERFAAVEQLLSKLPGVATARLLRTGPDWVGMQLSLNVGRDRVEQALGRHPRLEAVAAGAFAGSDEDAADSLPPDGSELTYRLSR